MFADIDEGIRKLLVDYGHINSGDIDVSFDMPTREWSASISRPTVNCYMFDVRVNNELRNPTPWIYRQTSGNEAEMTLPPVPIDVTYRITTHAGAVEDEHLLLGHVLYTLLKHPILPQDVIEDTILEGQEITASAAQPVGLIQSPADYWGALDNDIKPSLDYKLTAKVDLQEIDEIQVARISKIRVGHKVKGKLEITDEESLPGQVAGRIFAQDDPQSGIAGVEVQLWERDLYATTNDEGRFWFTWVPDGNYTLVITTSDGDERRHPIEVPSESYDVQI